MAIEVGNIFEGRVTGVKPFGAFVALPEGRVGMVHISEVSNEYVQDIATVLHDGDTVVNTVPAQVLSAEVLARLRPESLIVDLASRPGGTDFEAARRLGHRAIHALSLPAACAPETAGEAVAQTVCEMIGQREEA